MAKAQSRTVEYEDTIRDIFALSQDAGNTRADMESTLDSISDLCTDALPDLEEADSDDED